MITVVSVGLMTVGTLDMMPVGTVGPHVCCTYGVCRYAPIAREQSTSQGLLCLPVVKFLEHIVFFEYAMGRGYYDLL